VRSAGGRRWIEAFVIRVRTDTDEREQTLDLVAREAEESDIDPG
jgi:hypothetical protein